MTISNLIRDVIATEAVDYQYNAVLFNDISVAIGKIRNEAGDGKVTAKMVDKIDLASIISKHTNMNINMDVNDNYAENAWVFIPDLNRNNPILNPGYAESGYFSEKDVRTAINGQKWIDAQVDTARGQVGGFFSKLSVTVTLTSGLLTNKSSIKDYKFTNEEVAAILLHELGHLFTFLESMANTFRRNWILHSRVKDYLSAGENKVQKMRIITDLKNANMLDDDVDTNTIVNAGDKGVAVIITKSVKKINHDDNVYFHDHTAFESAADQFAVRMGAGRYLASALVKLVDNFWYKFIYYHNLLMSVCLFLISTLGVLTGHIGIFTAIFLNLLMIGSGIMENKSSYDTMVNRLTRIREEMITPLKKANIPEEMKKTVVRQYDELEKACKKSPFYKEYPDHKSFDGWIVEYIIPSLWRNRKSREYQQLMESLQNNELYVAAARF